MTKSISKTSIVALLATILVLIFITFAGTASAAKPTECTTIQDGILETAGGEIIPLGYITEGANVGYNYQAHLFNGDWGGDMLNMKWNDAWLSNKDCDGDGKLDRHLGYDTYIGSGAWLTNHFSGSYEVDEKTYNWTYFIKIVAVPTDAELIGDTWYTADGIEIGPVIWGQFAIIQELSNDGGAGEHGIFYKSPMGPGFGQF